MGPEEYAYSVKLGSTIAMAFDECVENPSPYDYTERKALSVQHAGLKDV